VTLCSLGHLSDLSELNGRLSQTIDLKRERYNLDHLSLWRSRVRVVTH
jgi:hypothetical protein